MIAALKSPVRFGLGILVFTFIGRGFAAESRGIQFIGFTNVSTFEKSQGSEETSLTSPEIKTIGWNELIASWNAAVPSNAWLRIEARGFHGERPTRYYNMGLWSSDSSERK